MKEHKTTFGTLLPSGELINVKSITQGQFMKCPFFIMELEHYNEDGTCKCNDPDHQKFMMKHWGHTKKSFKKAGIIIK